MLFVQLLSHIRLFVTPRTAARQTAPSPRVCSNLCPLSRWCHATISPSVIPFFSCPQSFPALGSFQISQFFVSGRQCIGISASASVLPINIQVQFPLGWTVWISLLSKGLSRVFQHHSSKASILRRLAFFIVQLSHPYMTTGKTTALTIQNFVHKVRSLLFNMLSRLVLVKSLSHVRLFATPWIVAYQALRSLSVHGIFQARVLEWVAISFSRGSSQPRDQTRVSRTAGRCFTVWATREA